ncbi:MAG: hypothetical protein ABW146_06080 [Candidatus Sedimenticola sp. 6PFRAG7]
MKYDVIVIMVGGRYFKGKGKSGRVQTAWSLAGAKLFGDWRLEEIEKAERLLTKKGYKPERFVVSVNECSSNM